jgi:hypothetical protein
MRVPPFHSIARTDRRVYHDNNRYTEGNNIEPRNRRPGKDNRPQCQHCQRLS